MCFEEILISSTYLKKIKTLQKLLNVRQKEVKLFYHHTEVSCTNLYSIISMSLLEKGPPPLIMFMVFLPFFGKWL